MSRALDGSARRVRRRRAAVLAAVVSGLEDEMLTIKVAGFELVRSTGPTTRPATSGCSMATPTGPHRDGRPRASRPAARSPSSPSCSAGEHAAGGARPFGSLEAAKFVGPLTSPLSRHGVAPPTTPSSSTRRWWSAIPTATAGWWSSTLADPGRARRADLRRATAIADLVRGRGRGLPPEGGAGRMTHRRPRSSPPGVRPPPGQLRRHHRVLRPRAEALGDAGVEADQPQPLPARLASPARPAPCPATTARPRSWRA